MSHSEIINIKGKPYMTFNDEYGYSPIIEVSRVGQRVKIDWSGQDHEYKPSRVADVREFQVTEIEHKFHFRGFTVDDPDKTITEIFFDSRGGWTERMVDLEQQRPLCYSHPILSFL